MKKLCLTMCALFGIASVAFAQERDPALDGNKIGIGAEFSLPNGAFGESYPIGFGGSVNYIHAINQKFKITGNAGFINYAGKEREIAGVTRKLEAINIIPVKAGARYYFADNFYAAGELGTAFNTKKTKSKMPFTYAPGLGVEFPVADKMTVDLSGRYEGWARGGANQSFFGIRAALNFGL